MLDYLYLKMYLMKTTPSYLLLDNQKTGYHHKSNQHQISVSIDYV